MIFKHLLIFITINLCLFSSEKIIIIGGGPAGLATAIEAKTQGWDVTVIEKRESYSRPQWIFLFDSSLNLLKKWKVSFPQMRIAEIREKESIGFVAIKHLEQQLEKRALELGVKKIQGEFKGLGLNRTVSLIKADQRELSLPYDLLVGADGVHSLVGKCLGIEKPCLGKGVGATAFFPNLSDGFQGCEISKPISHEGGFLRRIKLSSVSILLYQSPIEASKEKLQQALKSQGWDPEAEAASKNQGLILSDIEITLSQVPNFSHEEKAAILIGDAAATASFFQGIGANTAFKAAEISGQFFEEKRAQNPDAFKNFNHKMKETTDALIEDSAFLF